MSDTARGEIRQQTGTCNVIKVKAFYGNDVYYCQGESLCVRLFGTLDIIRNAFVSPRFAVPPALRGTFVN